MGSDCQASHNKPGIFLAPSVIELPYIYRGQKAKVVILSRPPSDFYVTSTLFNMLFLGPNSVFHIGLQYEDLVHVTEEPAASKDSETQQADEHGP